MKKNIILSCILFFVFAFAILVMPVSAEAKINKKIEKAYQKKVGSYYKNVGRCMRPHKIIVEYSYYDIDKNGIPELYIKSTYKDADYGLVNGCDYGLYTYYKGRIITITEKITGGGSDYIFFFWKGHFFEGDRGGNFGIVYKVKNGKKIKIKEIEEDTENSEDDIKFYNKYKKYEKKSPKLKMHKFIKKVKKNKKASAIKLKDGLYDFTYYKNNHCYEPVVSLTKSKIVLRGYYQKWNKRGPIGKKKKIKTKLTIKIAPNVKYYHCEDRIIRESYKTFQYYVRAIGFEITIRNGKAVKIMAHS